MTHGCNHSHGRNHSLRRLAFLAGILVLGHGMFATDRTALPKPTGPFAVGRASFHLVDTSRTDAQGSRTDHGREFMVVVWYPVEAGCKAALAEWLPADWRRLETDGLLGMQLKRSSGGAARDIASVLDSVAVRAREGCPVAKTATPFPLLVFSPGNLMFPTEYSSLLEEMASQGYVVIGHVPTGWVGVAFPDGRVTRRYNSPPDFALWTGDLTFILNQATAWNASQGSMFFGRLALDRIGVFGHSGGANAASIIAHNDKRVKVGLALDAGLLRKEDADGKPFLLLNAENTDFFSRNPRERAAVVGERNDFCQGSKPGIQVLLKGSDHNSFTDLTLVKAFDRPGDGTAFIDTTRAFLREFFGEFLMRRRSDLIRRGSVGYPLASVESTNWPAGSR